MNEIDNLIAKLQKNIFREALEAQTNYITDDIAICGAEVKILTEKFLALPDGKLPKKSDIELYARICVLNERINVQNKILKFTLETLNKLQNQD